jgi:uncharacterized protein (DUF1800 family)
MSTSLPSAIAAHRFGLGEADAGIVGTDPQAWLRGQIGPADPQHGDNLPDIDTALQRQAAARRQPATPGVDPLREQVQADLRARLATSVTTQRPFAERMAIFWCNHFSVSNAKGSTRGLVGAFEREAIRPHIAGRYVDLLTASTTHPAMLRYLDNQLSAGPQSRIVARLRRRAAEAPAPAGDMAAGSASAPGGTALPPRLTGLNENLARELLELHTLGVAGGGGRYGPWGGYTQADVTATAALLTGWRGPQPGAPGQRPPTTSSGGFDAAWHQPGPKLILGKRYDEGPQALATLLLDLSRQPATARFIATKLARHVVADEPPPALVERLARSFRDSDGDLGALYRTLIESPEAWAAPQPKLKTPEEFVISSARVLRLGERALGRLPDAGLATLGQRLQAPPSPAGWPDRADEWLGPEAIWQRVEWASRVAERIGGTVDARALAASSLGPLLGETARQQIERAADGPQALTLLLMAPEFQRR